MSKFEVTAREKALKKKISCGFRIGNSDIGSFRE